MAAPSNTVWGSIVGGYGRIGIAVTFTDTATTRKADIGVWFWSKYSVDDQYNTLYYDRRLTSGAATTSRGNVSINTTVATGSGWSTSNQVKIWSDSVTYTKQTTASTIYLSAKLQTVERVGGITYASMSFTVPALTSYKVSYNANGGSGAPSAQTKYYGKTLTLSSTKPTRTGYIFKGWATSASGSVAYASGASYTANAAVTLYAVWQKITYTVSYNANGGTGAPNSQTKTYGVNLTLSTTKPTRASYVDENGSTVSYTFKGWATSSSSSTVAYKAGATYTANASITLYAVWTVTTTVMTYDIVYETGDIDEDSPKVASQIKTKGTAITLSTTIPTRNGFTFSKWNTKSDGTGTNYNAGATYSTDADLTLYAIWTPWTHTVTFNVNGGSGSKPSNFTKTGGVDVVLSEIVPVRNGYTCIAWTTNANGTGKTYYAGEVYDNEQNGGTVTLYAKWVATDILIYTNGNCKARIFVEDEDLLGFINDGSVHGIEFIEGTVISFGSDNVKFVEIIER